MASLSLASSSSSLPLRSLRACFRPHELHNVVRLGPLRQHGLWMRPHWKQDLMSLLPLLDGMLLVSAALLGRTRYVGDVEEEDEEDEEDARMEDEVG